MFTPTAAKAEAYLFKSVPSSRVSPNCNPSKRANKVLNALPTTSALNLVSAVTVARAAVAYS